MNQPDGNEICAPAWGRSTPWRQGMLLSPEAAISFGFSADQGTAVVVITHDCDLAQSPDFEPCVEVLVGRFIEKVNGNYSHGKNSRTLHLDCTAGESRSTIAVTASDKHLVPKARSQGASLAMFQPRADVLMSPKEKQILQLWLASRYRRSAFPDEFDRRLGDETGVKERLTRALKESGIHISAIFFDVDEGHESQRNGSNDVYSLYITLMYSTAAHPDKAFKVAQQAANRIEEIFKARCRKVVADVERWEWIELCGIEVIADDAITVAQSQVLSKWHGDHISLRADSAQPLFIPE